MREETKAAIRLAVKRWFLRQARSIIERADEWIHKQELSLRDIHGVGRDTPLQTAIARECPTATDETAQEKPAHRGSDFEPFPQIALLAEDIGASRTGRRQSRGRGRGERQETHSAPATPVSWAQISAENSRRRTARRRPLWMLLALLTFAGTAQADSISDLSGKIHEAPGDTVTFTFTVDTLVLPSFVQDTLNGKVTLQDSAIGCHPCVSNYVNDIFLFGFTESVVLAEFGTPLHNYELIGTINGISLVDPPRSSVATPEPATWMFIAAGIAMLLVMWPRRRQVR